MIFSSYWSKIHSFPLFHIFQRVVYFLLTEMLSFSVCLCFFFFLKNRLLWGRALVVYSVLDETGRIFLKNRQFYRSKVTVSQLRRPSSVHMAKCNFFNKGHIQGAGEGNGNPLQYSCLENHGRRSLVLYSPQHHKESDTTERPLFHFRGLDSVTQSCLFRNIQLQPLAVFTRYFSHERF